MVTGMELDPTRAHWVQIFEVLSERIRTGQYPPGTRVPSVVQVVAEFGVATATAQKAMRALREAGLTRTEPGLGSFVLPPGGLADQG